MCLCSEIDRLGEALAHDADASQLAFTADITSSLARHLETVYLLLSKSKHLAKNLPYKLCRRDTAQERAGAIIRQREHEAPRKLFEKFEVNLEKFWRREKDVLLSNDERQAALLQDTVYSTINTYMHFDEDEAHQILLRRLSSIVVYLSSEVLPDRYNPQVVAGSFHDVLLFTDRSRNDLEKLVAQLRDAGSRYVNLAFQLGGIGAIWCLPLEVPRTTWERLPKRGKSFQTTVESLKSAGIEEQSRKYDGIAAQLIHFQIRPMMKDIGVLRKYLNPPNEIKGLVQPCSAAAANQSLLPSVLADPLPQSITDIQQSPALRPQQGEESEGFTSNFSQNPPIISTTWKPPVPFADNQPVFSNAVQNWISSRPRVAHSPSPPEALFGAENLFYNVKAYLENSCRNMFLDEHGTLLDPNGTELQNDLCNDFDSYCFTATMLLKRNSHEEFRRALSKACALVESILRAPHPRALACFLEVFIHLMQIELDDIALHLRDFVKRMSEKVVAEGHPWRQVCRLLGEIHPESLQEAMAQIWKYTVHIFGSELGKSGRLVVSIHLDYIKRVYGFSDCREEERRLRNILAQLGGIPGVSTPRVMLNLAHNLTKQRRYDEAETLAQEVIFLLQSCEIYAKRDSERIECKKIVSCSQFNQGKIHAAEQTMREAIVMIVNWRGPQHPWVLEFMNVLEGWLRNCSREDDANTISRQIGELMGVGEAC